MLNLRVARAFHRSARVSDAVVVSGTKLALSIRALIAQKVVEYNREHYAAAAA